jgi:predicted RNA-binding protein YlqC (UPF0109 family)
MPFAETSEEPEYQDEGLPAQPDAEAEALDAGVSGDVEEDDGEELPSDRVADLVEYFVVSLASDPDAISIDVTDGPDSSLIEVRVAPEDVGRVIGRHGRVVKSIRTLARACGSKLGINVEVEVVE